MADALPHLTALLLRVYGAEVPTGDLHKLKGEASTRRYYRFQARAGHEATAERPASLMVMVLPDTAEARDAGRAQAEAFLDVRAFLAGQRIEVPRVLASDLDAGLLLLEDLGDDTFEARLHREGAAHWPARYAQAIDLLADLHTRCAPPRTAAECVAYGRTFDAKLLRWELDHFREYGLDVFESVPPSARAALDRCFDQLTAAIVALPSGFVHRDYQSRNLMWAPDGRLCVIDFQDAFIGPAPYDLVALLCDSYVALDEVLQLAMLRRYFERRGFSSEQADAWLHGFRLIAVQRKLKDAGRFVFIDRVRGNPDFLPYFTQSLRYAARALRALPELAELSAWLDRLLPGFPERSAPAPQTVP
jgi:N-acetylmuramate 1-kinase